MVHVSSTMWRIKNQPSNSTSCSDNALSLLVLVVGWLYWELQVTSSFSTWGCVLKGCFARDMFWRAESRLKGIEDFDLIATCSTRSHQQLNCRLQADRQLEGMLAWFSAKVLLIHDLITSVLSSAVRFVLLNSRAKQGSRLHRHMQKVTLDTLVAIKVPCHTGSYYISLRISFSNQLPFVI